MHNISRFLRTRCSARILNMNECKKDEENKFEKSEDEFKA